MKKELVSCESIGKKYGRHWVFQNISFVAHAGDTIGIEGKNGSGKSTLLQIAAGFLTPSQGIVRHEEAIRTSFIGPYTEIIEEYTLHELLSFHSSFKQPLWSFEEMAEKASLPLSKGISSFSTGMKQRVLLITCFHFANDLLFFDEPTSNLDKEGFEWWSEEMKRADNCGILVATNDPRELKQCQKRILLE